MCNRYFNSCWVQLRASGLIARYSMATRGRRPHTCKCCSSRLWQRWRPAVRRTRVFQEKPPACQNSSQSPDGICLIWRRWASRCGLRGKDLHSIPLEHNVVSQWEGYGLLCWPGGYPDRVVFVCPIIYRQMSGLMSLRQAVTVSLQDFSHSRPTIRTLYNARKRQDVVT